MGNATNDIVFLATMKTSREVVLAKVNVVAVVQPNTLLLVEGANKVRVTEMLLPGDHIVLGLDVDASALGVEDAAWYALASCTNRKEGAAEVLCGGKGTNIAGDGINEVDALVDTINEAWPCESTDILAEFTRHNYKVVCTEWDDFEEHRSFLICYVRLHVGRHELL